MTSACTTARSVSRIDISDFSASILSAASLEPSFGKTHRFLLDMVQQDSSIAIVQLRFQGQFSVHVPSLRAIQQLGGHLQGGCYISRYKAKVFISNILRKSREGEESPSRPTDLFQTAHAASAGLAARVIGRPTTSIEAPLDIASAGVDAPLIIHSRPCRPNSRNHQQCLRAKLGPQRSDLLRRADQTVDASALRRSRQPHCPQERCTRRLPSTPRHPCWSAL